MERLTEKARVVLACAATMVPLSPAQAHDSWEHTRQLRSPTNMMPLGIGPEVAASDTGWILVGAGFDHDLGTDSGSVALWRMIDGAADFQETICHPRASHGAAFGSAVAIDRAGNRLCLGAPHEAGAGVWPDNFQMGRVYLYSLGDPGRASPTSSIADARGQWIGDGSIESQAPIVGARFGAAIALDRDRVVVGSPAHNGRGFASGRVEVFVKNATAWKFDGELVAPTHPAGMRFGTRVAISGDLALVGSPNFHGSASNSGCVDLFLRDADGWHHLSRLTAPAPQFSAGFGTSVAIIGNRVAIGAPLETPADSQAFPERAGAVHFFELGGAPFGDCHWTHTLTSPQPWCGAAENRTEAFGMSLALARDRIVVGASEACIDSIGDGAGVEEGAGSVYVFAWNAAAPAAWRIESRLTAPDAVPELHDGYRVAIGASQRAPFIVVGRLGNPDQSPGPGAAHVYAPTPPRNAAR